MGSNQYGQLGIGDKKLATKNSPVLVQSLAENSQIAKVANVSCGAYHTVINTLSGDVFSWG